MSISDTNFSVWKLSYMTYNIYITYKNSIINKNKTTGSR